MIELTGYRDKHEYVNKHGVKSVVYLMDCMTAMAQMGEKEFSLACVDPPYGLGKRTTDGGSKKNTQTKFMDDIRRTNWDDSVPSKEYFEELLRVSDNHIVWGGNYFELHSYRTFIVWDKMTYVPTMSQVELAVTSFDSPARLIQINSNQPDRQHPTQKPVALYDWIFHNYAKPNDTIFDSHLGSGSSRIAADKHNLPFTGVELDPDYFRDHCKRFDRYTAQLTLF